MSARRFSESGRETPRSGDSERPKTAITGTRGGEMVLRVNAPASGGKANRAASRFLARMLGVSASSIHLVSGEKSRHKKFEIVGLEPGEIREKLTDLLGSNPL